MNIPLPRQARWLILVGLLVSASAIRPATGSSPRPNILWITAEDLSPNLGAYGDPYAHTPRLDAFARESVRYTHAFATAPVCSPARSCLITGLYATSLGTQRLRSQFPVPAEVRGFPALLREAGYYTSNNTKTDYNLRDEAAFIRDCWNDSSPQAHWRKRPADQPFFAVFNLMTTHQSRVSVWPPAEFEQAVASRLAPGTRHDPAQATLPPYYPDTPETRRAWARYHDCITVMDQELAELLDQLDRDGLADETIVFFFGDNGMGLPRGKRCLWDTGLRMPLLIRFPEGWRDLAPAPAGDATDRLVSFVDFAPTVLSLCGVLKPPVMQGSAFLGEAAGPPRTYVYGARDRVDEVFDLSRSVRDHRFLYIRNFMPHLSWMPPEAYSDASAFRRELQRLAAAARLDAAQLTYAAPRKPLEELYDVESDPHQVHNLAAAPEHEATRDRLRAALHDWMLASRDAGFLTEPQMWTRLGADTTPFVLTRDPTAYPLTQLLEAADLVGRPEAFGRQLELLKNADDGVRYWAAVGLNATDARPDPPPQAWRDALNDASAVVRIEAAAGLVRAGDPVPGLAVLERELKNDSRDVALHAARALQLLGDRAKPVRPAMREVLAQARQDEKTVGDPAMYLRFSLEAALEAPEPARTTNTARLTLERIFSSGEYDSEGAPSFKWLKRSGVYLALEEPADKQAGRDLVRHDLSKGTSQVIAPAHWFVPPGRSRPLSIEDFALSDNAARLLVFTDGRRVWRANSRGDFWVLDLSSRELHQLGGDAPPASLLFAEFSPDGERVCYVRENNLYVQSLRDWQITALTTNGSPQLINGTFDWVYEEELFLRRGFRWSPDSRRLAYWQLDLEGVREFHLINDTDALYPRITSIPYPKTGQQNAAARIGVVRADGGPTRWLDVPGDSRDHYLARLEWNGDRLALQQFNRIQNTNVVMLANPDRGTVRTVLTESDPAWVENENDFRWLKDGRRFVWLSERDGWRHAYLASRSGRQFARITGGAFDVIRIEAVDEPGGWLYYLASPDNPTQQYLYRTRLEGGEPERLTPADQPGTHDYDLAPDAHWALHTYSTFTTPPVAEFIRLPEHTQVKALADNRGLRDKLAALPSCPREFLHLPIGDGVELDAWCIRPPLVDETQKYPVLFHVYGEPAGATVLNRWPGKGGLWHQMLAQEGYLVMSVDNRGTAAPRGRDWRKVVHRQIGLLASADQAAAVRALAERWAFVDTNRVAIWGWSGGGSMTLNAIFRYPQVYQTAMAVAPVPNQRYYDTIYQERYMGLPADNPDGYRDGSPINFAHQLQGNLLLVHGTGDDNCHYQGVEALINELVRHNKPFTMMAYPNRTHSISEGENTTRHVYETLTRFLTNHTRPGPLPR